METTTVSVLLVHLVTGVVQLCCFPPLPLSLDISCRDFYPKMVLKGEKDNSHFRNMLVKFEREVAVILLVISSICLALSMKQSVVQRVLG